MNKQPERSVEEIVEEFKQLADPDTPPCNDLYGEGSYSEWLKANPDKHLCSFEVYGEPMFDLDDERIADWLTQTLQAERQRCEEMVVAERGRIIDQIRQYRGRQVMAYGNDKLPFVVWEGKADEKEKTTIYEQAFKDILQALTQPTPLTNDNE